MTTSDHPVPCPTCGRGAPASPQPPAIGERTPELVRAEQRLDRRQREYDAARAAFDAAAAEHYAARSASWARTRTVMVDGGASLREVGGADPATAITLADAEASAMAAMNAAGRELVEARLAHHDAARAARAAFVT